jgi:Flp pilus assembly protein TadB
MVSYQPYAPGEFPAFGLCGHKFTTAQSQAVESADAKAHARAATESERRREQQRAAAERHAAEAPRREAIRRKAEAVEKQRMACLDATERRTWLALWLWVALVFAGATVTLLLVAGGSLALVGATIVPCAFAVFRLLIVGFDPPVKLGEDLYVTLVWGVMGLTAGFLLHVLAGTGS